MKWKTKAISILLSGLMLTSSMGVGITAFAAEETASVVSEEVSSYDEVKFWLDMGWIKLYEERSKI